MKRLYVGNLPFSVTQDDVMTEFSKYGLVQECKLITDRETGKLRGFGFVTFANAHDADTAINALNGQNFGGRTLTVNEAEERRPAGGGNFRSQGQGNGGGGGGGNSRPVVVENTNRRGGGGGRGGRGRRDQGGDRYDD